MLSEELKSAKKIVGVKQSTRAVEKGEAQTAFIAKDADEKVIAGFRELCIQNSVEIIYIDTMKQLGRMCGIEVGAATAVIPKKL